MDMIEQRVSLMPDSQGVIPCPLVLMSDLRGWVWGWELLGLGLLGRGLGS